MRTSRDLRSEFVVDRHARAQDADRRHPRGGRHDGPRARVTSPDALRDYAQLVVQESKRLTRLVDNLLAYARITDVTEAYTFTALDVGALLDEVRGRVPRGARRRRLRRRMWTSRRIRRPIRGDRTACLLLFDNLVDNAIRYSPARALAPRSARAADRGRVDIEVADRGMGIPADGTAPRHAAGSSAGRGAGSGGSGLGLAIASRIARGPRRDAARSRARSTRARRFA